MGLMDTLRHWLGQPPDKELVERSLRRHERVQELEQRQLRALEARVRVARGDEKWRPTPTQRNDPDDKGAGA